MRVLIFVVHPQLVILRRKIVLKNSKHNIKYANDPITSLIYSLLMMYGQKQRNSIKIVNKSERFTRRSSLIIRKGVTFLDETIYRRAIKKEEAAFLAVMQEFESLLYHTALGYLKSEHDAIEAVQEVTYRAYRKIHTVKNPAYLKTWLVRIMLNVCYDALKQQKRQSHEIYVEPSTVLNDYTLQIEEALATLSKEHQEIVHLKYFQSLKNAEIARIQEIPEGTVKSRLHKALQKLRIFFEEEEES